MRRFFVWLYAQSWWFRTGVFTMMVVLGSVFCVVTVAEATQDARAGVVAVWISPLVVSAVIIWLGSRAVRNTLK